MTVIATNDREAHIDLEAYDRDEASVLAMASVLGIIVQAIGQAFDSVLYSGEQAWLEKTPSGTVVYHDPGGPLNGKAQWQTLAAVRAALAGRRGRVSEYEYVTWKLRLVVEAGLEQPVHIDAPPLPPGRPEYVHRVWEGFLFLFACRWCHTYGEPAPFAREFGSAWCGVPTSQVRAALEWLRKRDFAHLVGTQPSGKGRPTYLWLPRESR
jgi:hypothetical protein